MVAVELMLLDVGLCGNLRFYVVLIFFFAFILRKLCQVQTSWAAMNDDVKNDENGLATIENSGLPPCK